jgi:two-component system, chemotaxis family, protein-glutamate methylesterase/glutaminase
MTTAVHEQVRVLVVDDSSFIRRAVIRMFENDPVIRIIDVAADGEMALERIRALRPDVVTLDVKMPVMDGLTALARIMKECPTPVVMLSSLTEKGGENTLRALELGAVDFVDKTSAGGPMDISGLSRELGDKIMIAARVNLQKIHGRSVEPVFFREKAMVAASGTELVLIGSSTGGPPALQTVLADIPAGFPCPVLVVQHMPPGFTTSLAERLNRTCALPVKEGEDGELILAGHVYIAPAGKQLTLHRVGEDFSIRLGPNPADTLHRPSVDVLFQSAASVAGDKCLALVLTGMGRDGAAGAVEIKRAGGRVVVESEETAIVYGMPKAVDESVKVDGKVPLYQVAETILRMI